MLKSSPPGGSTRWSCPGSAYGFVPYTPGSPGSNGALPVATAATSRSWSGQLPGTPSQLKCTPKFVFGGYSTRYSGETALVLVCVGNGDLIGVDRYSNVPVSAL